MALFVCTAPRGSRVLAGILRTRGTFGIARRPARSRSCDWRFRTQPSGRPNTSSPAECLRATQWPACGRQPRGVGKQCKRDSFSVWKQRGPCSRGKRRHRVPRLATSQLVGFILGYHSGRLRVLLLVASPLQTRVLVQSVVLPLRQHFGLRHHWLLWGGSRPLSGQGRAYRELPQCHHGGRSERIKHVRLQNV